MTGDLDTVRAVEDALRNAQTSGALNPPAGYAMQPVGSFQKQTEASQRLMWLVPLVIRTDLFIISLQFRHLEFTLAVWGRLHRIVWHRD